MLNLAGTECLRVVLVPRRSFPSLRIGGGICEGGTGRKGGRGMQADVILIKNYGKGIIRQFNVYFVKLWLKLVLELPHGQSWEYDCNCFYLLHVLVYRFVYV